MSKINLKPTLLLFATLLFSGSMAQAQQTTQSKTNQKTEQQKAQEYEAWTKMRDDWANLNRYREANAQLGTPAPNEDRVVFMGNSITEGWVNLSPGFFAGRPYIGRGISGQTTPQMLIRFQQDVIDLKPKVVVILAGTNDIAGNTGPSTQEMIEDNLTSMVELAQANGIKVVLSSLLPAYDFPWKPGQQPAEKIIAINEWIKSYAAQHNIVYLDYFTAMADNRNGLKEAYTKDGVHPTAAGYKVMEPLAEKAISKALQQD